MLSERLLGLMKERGWEGLTEIQGLAIPVVASGANALVIAPTGWGKTEAALLPLFDRLIASESRHGIQILYISPMRSLNRDLLERMKWWSEKLGISIEVRHGDTSQAERQKQARNPPQVLVTTPETLWAILPAKRIGEALKNVEHVVVDEVHELFGDKRGAQLALALERLLEKRERRHFQRIGLSATVGNPEEVAAFLSGGRGCEIVRLPVERSMHLRVEAPQPGKEDYEVGERLFIDGPAAARLSLMDGLIRSHTSTLTFVNTRQVAETLTSRLLKLREEEPAIAVHHGSLSKEARVNAEQGFRGGEVEGLLCTSSLELGIDVGTVDLVIQYLSPRQVQRLVQRVGRSGHTISGVPKGVIIASDEDDVLESAVIARRAAKGLLESEREHENALDVLALALAGMLLEKGEMSVDEIRAIASRAHPFRNITNEQIVRVAKQLHDEGNIFFDTERLVVRRSGRTRLYYYDNLSMIPDEQKFFVKNAVTNTNVAMLDEGFVASYIENGSTFIARGVPWKVLDIGEKEIIVEPAEDISAAVPDWVGEEIPVPQAVACEVAELRRRIADGEEREKLMREYHLSAEAYEKCARLIERQAKLFLPDEKNVLVEQTPDSIVLHIALGTKGNETLARFLGAAIGRRLGHSVRTEADPHRIVLQAPILDADDIVRLLKESSPEYAERAVRDSVPGSSAFRHRFIHVAKKFGLIEKEADYRSLNMQRIVDSLIGSPIYEETLRQFEHDCLDLDAMKAALEAIASGKLKLHVLRLQEHTPLAKLTLLRLSAAIELIAPIEPSGEILKGFMLSTLQKQAKLWCTYCGAVQYSKLEELPEKIACTSCGSPLMAVVDARDERFSQLAKKRKAGKALTADENKRLGELLRSAGLVEAYGKKAVIALSVYGVGVETAARVLRNIRRDERLFFADLLDAQKQFIRTRRYWELSNKS